MSIIIKSGASSNLAGVNSRTALLTAAADTDAPTYIASVQGQANTAQSDSIAIESGSINTTRIRRLIIFQPGNQTTGGIVLLQLIRTTTAGTAGVTTPSPSDTADSFTGVVRAKPTGLGTGGVVLLNLPMFIPGAAAAFTPIIIDLDAIGLAKSMKIPVGIANGISLRHPGSTGAANFSAAIVFTEETT